MTKEDRKKYNKEYRENHKEELKLYRDSHKEEIQQYRDSHKKELKEYHADYWKKHKEERKQYVKEHREEINGYSAKYRVAHKKEINKKFCQMKRMDNFFRLKHNLRSRISIMFTRLQLNKTTRTEKLLGTDYQTAMQHINSKFTFGMRWDKVGKEIHIDHIIPLSSAKTEEELIKLCHYTNLQPLWAKDNLKKGAKTNYKIGEIIL